MNPKLRTAPNESEIIRKETNFRYNVQNLLSVQLKKTGLHINICASSEFKSVSILSKANITE